MDMERATAFGHCSASRLRDRDRASANIVVDLHVLIVLERELHREICGNRVVMNAAPSPLPHLDAIKLLCRALPSANEAVVEDFTIAHPDREDRPASNTTFNPWCALFPATPSIDELAIVNLRPLHRKRPKPRPSRLFNP